MMNEIIQCADLHHYGNDQMNRVYSPDGISPAILVVSGGGREIKIEDGMRIRKMTPKECFRLMGFDDRDINVLIKDGISKTQLYKMAGNSICVPVLEHIFKELVRQKVF